MAPEQTSERGVAATRVMKKSNPELFERRRAGAAASPEKPFTEGGVEAVDRALLILQAFRDGDVSLSLTEIANRTGYYKSTILRLLRSLENFSYIFKGSDGRYRIGPAAWRLGVLFQRELRIEDRVLPILQELATQTSETVAFWIPLLNSRPPLRLCFLRLESPHEVTHHFRIGDTMPLAGCPDEALGTTGRLMRAFLFSGHPGDEAIRTARVFSSFGLRDPDVLGVSAAVFDSAGGLVGGVSLSAPTGRRDAAWARSMEPVVLSAADRATLALGGVSLSRGSRL